MRKKLLENVKNDPNRWVVSYADFTTMLLALFVVLYAVSQIDIAKMRDFTSSLKRSFSSVEKEVKKKKKNLENLFSTTNVKITTKPVEMTFQEQIDSLKEKLQNAEEKIPTDMVQLDNVKNLLDKEFGTQNNINMVHSERGLTISLADTILFDTGSAEIKNQADSTLEKIASIIKDIPNSVRIEGHTDDKPIKTSLYPSNWELSTARATSLVRQFVDKYQVSPDRISAAGYGEYRPIDTNTTPEGRQKNRRVDIVILSVGSQIFEPQAE
ncbi:MAG: OmpA family protein [Vampirovibrionia bacterium]